MASDKDGGPAFPMSGKLEYQEGPNGGSFVFEQPGMSLLTWFAGRALTRHEFQGYGETDEGRAALARDAYDLAEAMIAEKRKREGNDND